MAGNWKEYQEEAAEFFRSLGLEAATDVAVAGVRTSHDVDVVVKIKMVGFEATWLVECKHWKDAVNKLHVLALREIVSDVGADRGIILCEAGFQSGAIEASKLTNVQVSSLAELGTTSRSEVFAVRLRDLYDRNETARARYWEIPKGHRIDTGLRYDMGDENLYSGAFIVDFVSKILIRAFRASYPIVVDEWDMMSARPIPASLNGPEDVVTALEPLITELEAKLDGAEASLPS
ncbi:restriction endonuclease [Sphingomonas sp. RS2018]